MKLKTSMRGWNEMNASLKRFSAEYPERIKMAVYHEAQIDMTEAKRRTPVDITENAPHPGQLRASGAVSEPEQQGKEISVTLSFGTDYAIHVHENPDALHPVGEWKFLESVLNESRPFMGRRLAARLRFGDKS